jgi:hypothetical protein
MTKAEAISKLEAAGAIRAKMEDRHGDTRSGWWMDGVFLGPVSDPRGAWQKLGHEELNG